MTKELKLDDYYIKPDENFNITSIELTDDLVLKVGIDKKISIPYNSKNKKNVFKLSNSYVKSDNHKTVSYVYLSDDLVLYVGYDAIKDIIIEPTKDILLNGDEIQIKLTAIGYDNQKLNKVPISIYEEYTPEISLRANKHIIQSGEEISFKVVLKDAEDGSRVRQAGEIINLYGDTDDSS